MTWLLMNPAKAPVVWKAIWTHRPKDERNVITLPVNGRPICGTCASNPE